jgi:flagellar basal-body rod protein FlgC
MFGALDISTSGMLAQRMRLTTISANIANRNSVMPDGTPYKARMVSLGAGNPEATGEEGRELGVHVASVELDHSPFNLRYEPNHPFALKSGPYEGYVQESNVNPVVEQVNMLQATRAYEANAAAAETTKAMIAQALRLIA